MSIKKRIVLMIFLASLVIFSITTDIMAEFCFKCPVCGASGIEVERHQIGSTRVIVYECFRKHICKVHFEKDA